MDNARNKMKPLLAVLLASGVATIAETEELPWKFDGSTNRVAASTCTSVKACESFCAYDVAVERSDSPWDGLVRSIWTSAKSAPASIPVSIGLLLIVR